MRQAGIVPLSFDDLVEPFEQGRGLPADALRAFADLVSKVTGGSITARVVEPGIGTGRLALPLLLSGCHVTGVDISRPMLDRLTVAARGLPGRCGPVLASATALPFANATFDLGYVANLFYLIPDWETALAELARVVKPGGVVLVCRERSVLSPALTSFDATWRELIEATGFRHERAQPDDQVVLRTMEARISPPETRILARWTIGQTVAAALDGYGDRLRPLYASMPDHVWTRTVETFGATTRELFRDPATRLDCQVSFEVAMARVP